MRLRARDLPFLLHPVKSQFVQWPLLLSATHGPLTQHRLLPLPFCTVMVTLWI